MADFLRSNNPVLKESAFGGQAITGETMTIQGTVNKTGLLLFFVVVSAAWTWGLAHSEQPGAAFPWMIGGAIALVYLANMVMSVFFHAEMSFLNAATPLGIGISVVIVIIAALNLILDFDMIETAARMGAPKYMEWYGAFGLMVTLIWLYMEILRLLAKTRRR
jgi:uncharacterized YccA/Bax inhibitor family protein